jgi:tRNA threonylcarbamoyladenosine biosynthesis protein TsaB
VGDAVNILAIETATTACAIGLWTSSGERLAVVLDQDRRHTESLMPGVRDLLASAEIAARDIDRVVVDRGPGLYTGLRVGIATAVGFALAANCDLVGVTSLELLAAGAHRAGVRGRLLCAVDGRRGEIFHQSFNLDGGVRSTSEPAVARASDVAGRWSAGPVTVTGDGASRYEAEFRVLAAVAFFDQRVPPVIEALELAATREPTAVITPLYLREADAVANFSTRERSS